MPELAVTEIAPLVRVRSCTAKVSVGQGDIRNQSYGMGGGKRLLTAFQYDLCECVRLCTPCTIHQSHQCGDKKIHNWSNTASTVAKSEKHSMPQMAVTSVLRYLQEVGMRKGRDEKSRAFEALEVFEAIEASVA